MTLERDMNEMRSNQESKRKRMQEQIDEYKKKTGSIEQEIQRKKLELEQIEILNEKT